MTWLGRTGCACIAWAVLLASAPAAELPEYKLKAAFLYNFALFTEWPADTGNTVTLCVTEGAAFRDELEEFQGQPVGARRFVVRRIGDTESSQGCQILFLPKAAAAPLSRAIDGLRGRRVLTVGDSPEAAQAGVCINMGISDAHLAFDVDLKATRSAGLNLSSKLLRLAHNVR